MDRDQSIEVARQGYGTIGNDACSRMGSAVHLGPPAVYVRSGQGAVAPESSRPARHAVRSPASDADANLMPLALIFEQGAKKAGVKLQIKQEPTDTFWARPTAWSPSPSARGVTARSSPSGCRLRRVQHGRDQLERSSQKKAYQLVSSRRDRDPARRTGACPRGAEVALGRRRLHHPVLQADDRRASTQGPAEWSRTCSRP